MNTKPNPTCFECGQVAGKHFAGCPEAPDLQQCRCCGMDKECRDELAGPICAECACPEPDETSV